MPSAKVSPSLPTTAAHNCQSIKSIKCLSSWRPLRPLYTTTSCESNPSPDKSGSDNSLLNYSTSSASDMKKTPYQRIVRLMEVDDRWQREVTLGRRVGFYRFRGDIGAGNFSQVKVALHCLTREKVAVKILDKSKLDTKTRKMLTREIGSMEKLHHPNVISLFEVVETLSKFYLVMEFAPNGELYQYINREGRLEETEAKPMFAQIVAAIDHMHSHNIIHRDLKAENIFLSERKLVKVGDYGFSTHIVSQEQLLSTFCGSPPYAAPELFHDESYIGPNVDYWALGVLLYFMATALMPFKAQTISALKKLIIECDYEIPKYMSDECMAAINGLLQVDCSQRWNLKQLKDCEWLKEQTFADSLPQLKMKVLSKSNIEVNNNNCLTDEERLVHKHLNALGIDEALIAENLDKGSRSSVTGSFNIIANKILSSKLKAQESLDKDSNGNYCQQDSDNQSNNTKPINDSTHYKSSKSISKSIKSMKNVFVDKSVRPRLEQSSSLGDDHLRPDSTRHKRRLRKSRTCCLL